MTQDPAPPPAAPPFQLPKSGLTLNGTRLTRRAEKGEVIAEFEVSEMSGIEFRSRRDTGMVLISLVFAASAVALAMAFRTSVWAWTGAVMCACIAGAFMLGAPQHCVAFAVGKNNVEFPILDSTEDGRAFVLMLQQTQRRPRH